MDGVLIAAGEGLVQTPTFEDASLIDLPPTILHILGVEVPSDMDGKVLSGLFTRDGELAMGPVRYMREGSANALQDATRAVVRSGKRL